MAEIKTKPTNQKVTDFLNSVNPEQRRKDGQQLLQIMREITHEEPAMWGPSIIGFGTYHYKYDSGHEGDMCRMGFSPRKSSLVVYLMPGFDKKKDKLQKLGKHKTSVSCLYINKLDDIDIEVLKDLLKETLQEMNKLYPVS